jgi:hypothetical protein
VRRKGRDPGFGSTLAQDVEHCLICEPADCDLATFVDPAEKRPAVTAMNSNLVSQSISRAIGRICEPIFSTFSSANRQFLCLGVIAREIGRNRLPIGSILLRRVMRSMQHRGRRPVNCHDYEGPVSVAISPDANARPHGSVRALIVGTSVAP